MLARKRVKARMTRMLKLIFSDDTEGSRKPMRTMTDNNTQGYTSVVA